MCSFCQSQTESINHLFFLCNISRDFWKDVSDWLQEQLHIPINLENLDVIFGKNIKNEPLVLNIIILLGKSHIYRQRCKQLCPRLQLFLIDLKFYYNIERYIYLRKNKMAFFEKRWHSLNEFFNHDT